MYFKTYLLVLQCLFFCLSLKFRVKHLLWLLSSCIGWNSCRYSIYIIFQTFFCFFLIINWVGIYCIKLLILKCMIHYNIRQTILRNVLDYYIRFSSKQRIYQFYNYVFFNVFLICEPTWFVVGFVRF